MHNAPVQPGGRLYLPAHCPAGALHRTNICDAVSSSHSYRAASTSSIATVQQHQRCRDATRPVKPLGWMHAWYCHGGVSDLWSRGPGFDSRSGHYQVVTTCVSPKCGIEIGRNFPPVLGSGSPQFLTQVFPSILFFPSLEKVLLIV